MTDDDDPEIGLGRRTTEQAIDAALADLDDAFVTQLAAWTLRMGFGPLFLNQTDRELTPECVAALCLVPFSPAREPAHADALDQLEEWYRLEEKKRREREREREG